ncbi:MAG: calcium/sodium antiporter, partial [Polyangiaceae bacterium]|nr:calcium/sodium antiporter [Polyangiaceae bacterium]
MGSRVCGAAGELLTEWIELIGGGILLYFGAEWFVAGASALALALRVPQIIVGLTVVAYGTSAPEIIVGVQAASAGHGEVALGNVIGSNIANIGLILGIAALIQPARVDGNLRNRELPVLLASAAVIPLILLDGSVSRWEAGGLLLVAFAYTVWMIRVARTASVIAAARLDAIATSEVADVAGAPKPTGRLRSLVTAVFGLVVLLVGGDLFIDGAVSIADSLGVSDRLIGLTVVAVGTSLPELVTAVIAARRGHSDLAVGNVVGSNIFNTFLCLGAAGLAGSVRAPLSTLAVDLVALVVVTAVAGFFIRGARTITRPEGALAF